jgi:hypothetical protein
LSLAVDRLGKLLVGVDLAQDGLSRLLELISGVVLDPACRSLSRSVIAGQAVA